MSHHVGTPPLPWFHTLFFMPPLCAHSTHTPLGCSNLQAGESDTRHRRQRACIGGRDYIYVCVRASCSTIHDASHGASLRVHTCMYLQLLPTSAHGIMEVDKLHMTHVFLCLVSMLSMSLYEHTYSFFQSFVSLICVCVFMTGGWILSMRAHLTCPQSLCLAYKRMAKSSLLRLSPSLRRSYQPSLPPCLPSRTLLSAGPQSIVGPGLACSLSHHHSRGTQRFVALAPSGKSEYAHRGRER